MEKKILIPITIDDVNKKVVQRADIWGQRSGAELRFLYVRLRAHQSDSEFSLGGMSANTEKKKEEDYQKAEKFIKELDIKSKYSISIRGGAVGSQIDNEDRSYKPDLIIFAALSKTIISRLFIDNMSDYSIHHSKCPLFIYKDTMRVKNNHILVPVDYSEINKKAIAIADEWAGRTDSLLHFVHVARKPEGANFTGDMVWIEDKLGNMNERRQQQRIKNVSLEERQKLESYLNRLDIQSDYKFTSEFGEVNVKLLHVQRRLNANLLILTSHSQVTGDHSYIGGNVDNLLNYTDCSIFLYKDK